MARWTTSYSLYQLQEQDSDLMPNRRSGCGGGRGGTKPGRGGDSEVRLAALERNG